MTWLTLAIMDPLCLSAKHSNFVPPHADLSIRNAAVIEKFVVSFSAIPSWTGWRFASVSFPRMLITLSLPNPHAPLLASRNNYF